MSARSKKAGDLVLGGEPRVNLLPPEVHAQVKQRATRRMLGLLVVLAVAAVAGGYVAVQLRAVVASAELVAAQQRTQDLLSEQAKYAEATKTSGMVKVALDARTLALSNEVLWSDLIDHIRGVLPADATLDSAKMTAHLPWEAEMATQGPLRAPRVATVEFVVKSASLLDTPSVVRALASIPGFADATPDRVDRNDTTFNTTITLNLNVGVVYDRFTGKTGETK